MNAPIPLRIAAICLIVLCCSKVALLSGASARSGWPDPIATHMSFHTVHYAAAALEFTVACLILLSNRASTSAWALLMLVSVFMGYRILFVLYQVKLPCSCLGILEKWFNLSGIFSHVVAVIVLAALAFCAISTITTTRMAQAPSNLDPAAPGPAPSL